MEGVQPSEFCLAVQYTVGGAGASPERATLSSCPPAGPRNISPLGCAGTSHWPAWFSPHPTSAPSLRRAKAWLEPALPSTYVNPSGSVGACGRSPHATTQPSLRRARLESCPALTAV